jgi:hypothetical protein
MFVEKRAQFHTDWVVETSEESDQVLQWLDTEKERSGQVDTPSRQAVHSSNSFRVQWKTLVTNTMTSNPKIWKSHTLQHTVAKSAVDGFHEPVVEQRQATTTR